MQVLGTLPYDLRSKILHHLYAGVIARVPLLQTMAHDDMFLTDVCVRLQHYTCTQESFVYQRGGRLGLLLARLRFRLLNVSSESSMRVI